VLDQVVPNALDFQTQVTIGIHTVTGTASTLYLIRGTTIRQVWHHEVRRQNGTRRGGQSAPRIQRIRDMDVHVFESTIREAMGKWLSKMQGLILVGNGPLFQRATNAKCVAKIPFAKFEKQATIQDACLLQWYQDYHVRVEARATQKVMTRLKTWVECNPDKLIYGLEEFRRFVDQGNVKRVVVHRELASDTIHTLIHLCKPLNTCITFVRDPWLLGFGGFMGVRFY